MPKVLKVATNLTVEELYKRYRSCSEATEKTHWQIIWLKAQGNPTKDIAKVTGFNPDWIRRIVRRYNELGEESLGDGRRDNGNDMMLSAEQLVELRQALCQRPPDGGLWNSRKVAQWIADKVGHRVHPQTGWEYLQREKMSLHVPRPQHPENLPEDIEAFKKNSKRNCTI